MKEFSKRLANGVALGLVLLPWLVYRLEAAVCGESRVFPGWSQFFSLFPGTVGVYFRRAFYRLVFPQCAADVWIGFGTVFSHPSVRIGRSVYIGVGCMVGDVTLADDVLIGSHVSIINGRRQHGIERLDVPVREQPGEYPRVTVGADTWIGDRALVSADLGRHCVVGGGSVVTKPAADYAIVAGSPAKVIGWRGDQAREAPRAQPADFVAT